MCNSKRNKFGCASFDDSKAKLMEQDCDELPLAVKGEANYTVCRKMTQKIFSEDGEEEERIIRQCGTAGEIGCNRQTRPRTLQVYTCHCDHDLCNAATPLQRPSSVTFVVTTSCLVLSWAAHLL
ncbi:hypothetical protein BaRGS_00000873 [Batillaria attramentaria]|uniref:Protein sleepless n=1 Tax=Batillaria attramentaria TaxID=370345 RepID=A0ABD0M7W9_9CAEN